MTITIDDWTIWEQRFVAFLETQLADADGAHDLAHIQRVVANAKRLAAVEQARLEIVIPAGWLHDCVTVPKNSPLRSQASTLAGEAAADFLRREGYPELYLDNIAHAITAHSFSAGIAPRTIEAQVVQDADRLDSLGAIGIARCLITGVSMGTDIYCAADPFGESGRERDDKLYSVDHFYIKLFKLAEMMQTAAGRAEAARRTEYMKGYLAQLRNEITT